ncbi:transcriptional regulator of the spore photoproduct lyase operon [Bacillus ectoiniformans]|uniref:transcriptional regulator SplA domain-containing protein n=1 Tax=Bacillus ectoiniformans TaxID=1494429 RepID=UPI00195B4787|nr:transcriptional regulator SplA domain-containing protein [Bacillus ectoiniformans]MBM7649464.1 transcriptional regulator of the spore photoproduct lyase operon [Bacillus ectoiniformans]
MEVFESHQESFHAGDIVYVLYRNPHTYNVANIQEAAIVNHPDRPGELALFLYETFYPLDADIAIYSSADQAEAAYAYYYGTME